MSAQLQKKKTNDAGMTIFPTVSCVVIGRGDIFFFVIRNEL